MNSSIFSIITDFPHIKEEMTGRERFLVALIMDKVKLIRNTEHRIIELSKDDICKWFNLDISTPAHQDELLKLVQCVNKKSFLCDHRPGEWKCLSLFTGCKLEEDSLSVSINEDLLKVFNLLDNRTFLLLRDTFVFPPGTDGDRAFVLYGHLLSKGTSGKTTKLILSTKGIKNLFGIPKDGKGSYMRSSGSFDRANFEERVIEPTLNVLLNCSIVKLQTYSPDTDSESALYRKVKRGHTVAGYEVLYKVEDKK